MQAIIKKALLVASLLAIALPVYADRGGCGLRYKLESMENRIDRGIDDGRLTQDEIRQLQRERREIRNLYLDLQDDDMLDERGCGMLERRIDRLSRHISELKHNYRNEDDGDSYRGYRR